MNKIAKRYEYDCQINLFIQRMVMIVEELKRIYMINGGAYFGTIKISCFIIFIDVNS